MENHKIDHNLTEILFSGERGTFIRGEHFGGGGRQCVGPPVHHFTNTPAHLPNNARPISAENIGKRINRSGPNFFVHLSASLNRVRVSEYGCHLDYMSVT